MEKSIYSGSYHFAGKMEEFLQGVEIIGVYHYPLAEGALIEETLYHLHETAVLKVGIYDDPLITFSPNEPLVKNYQKVNIKGYGRAAELGEVEKRILEIIG